MVDHQQNGMTHAYIVEFASASDRDFYVSDDQGHKDIGKYIRKFIAKAQVVDFQSEVF